MYCLIFISEPICMFELIGIVVILMFWFMNQVCIIELKMTKLWAWPQTVLFLSLTHHIWCIGHAQNLPLPKTLPGLKITFQSITFHLFLASKDQKPSLSQNSCKTKSYTSHNNYMICSNQPCLQIPTSSPFHFINLAKISLFRLKLDHIMSLLSNCPKVNPHNPSFTY